MTNAPKTWVSLLAPYRAADDTRAWIEISLTLILFVANWAIVWGLAQLGTPFGYVLAALLVFPAGGLIVRLFIIQHDCGHGSMFSTKRMNNWVGRALGVVTLTPYEYWRRLHASHHASSGNLDRRGMGDIDTLTVHEYKDLKLKDKVLYRLYRHPVVLFLFGPAYLFILRHRLPVGSMGQRKSWISTMLTNLSIAIAFAVMFYVVGIGTFLMIHLPIVAVGASIGVWLFYVQHQFEKTHWEKNPDWTHAEAALHGSSYYDLPKPIMWLTGNIGIHHVHHLCSSIPFHKLPKVIEDYPELKDIGRLTFKESLKCIRFALWDEEKREMISFRDLRRSKLSPA